MAAVLARTGAGLETEELIDELAERFPDDTIMHSVRLPMARGELALVRGSPESTVEILRVAAPYERAFLEVPELRGRALLAAGRAAEAAVEFQKLLDLPGVWPTRAVHPLALLGLARARAMAGENEESLHGYRDFLALWTDADAGIPLLLEARAEYEAAGAATD